jgi:hypothetical protein
MKTSALTQVHRVVQIDLYDIVFTHVDHRTRQHAVYGKNSSYDSIGRYTIRLHATGLIEWTIEASSTKHRVPLHGPIVLANHWFGRVR